MEFLHEYAMPFYFKGNDIGCLIIHGFTGSPAQMRLLGEVLRKEGYTVSGILLKGHGTTIEDMEKTNWQDWWNTAKEAYAKLKQECRKVYVMGLSMGGILSLLLAETYEIDKVISIAAPIRIYSKLSYLAPILKYFKKYEQWAELPLAQGEVGDPYTQAYKKIPVAAIPSLLKLMRKAEKGLHHIMAPILIIQSRMDETVIPQSAQMIYEGVASREKQLIWLEKSKHVCTLGPEREYMHEQMVRFLKSEIDIRE